MVVTPLAMQRQQTLEALASPVRSPHVPYCPRLSARHMAVTVVYEPLEVPLSGLTFSDSEVVISSTLDDTHQRITLAHELGHILVLRRVVSYAVWPGVETFADAFARELLIPLAHVRSMLKARRISLTNLPLSSPVRVACGVDARLAYELADSFCVPVSELVAQLQLLGVVPDILRAPDAVVVCARCGSRPTDSTCPCLVYRQRPRRELVSLECV